jgi:hypothetical protein
MKDKIRHILKEESIKKNLLDLIKSEGIVYAIELSGGFDNLISIIGNENMVDVLLGFFDNLELKYFRGNPTLSQGYDTFLEKSSQFWGGDIIVYDDGFRMILKDVPNVIYKQYRRDILKKIIRKYPELNDGSEVIVFADRGKYRKFDKFYVDNDEEQD